MKYLPLVWAALRRHTTESLLTFLVLTIAFTLFSAMVALNTAYERAITVNRMDRLLVANRFCCDPLSIARRSELTRMPGVRGAALIQGVFGYQQEPAKRVGIYMLDGESIAAVPELPLTAENWKQMEAKPDGLFFTRKEAEKWNVKAGDRFPVQAPRSGRQDGSPAWPFEVLGVIENPEPRIDWMPNIYGNFNYLDAAITPDRRGRANYILAIDDPDKAESICQKIDTRYANSEMPTYCVPLQLDARSIVESVISMKQMSVGIAAAGLFMILFLCANGIAESVRERIPEFAVLKTIGFGDRQVAVLVLLESALPCLAGAVLGIVLAQLASNFTTQLDDGNGLTLPPASISIGIAALALGVALLIGAASAALPLRRLRTMELAPALAGR
jgi:putative ABC transport system permease protein